MKVIVLIYKVNIKKYVLILRESLFIFLLYFIYNKELVVYDFLLIEVIIYFFIYI